MSGRPTIAYQPALDGLRAIAVIAVLLFHGGVPGFEGGYLGVSVFFTLSGYLITSLLLDEHDRTGRIDLPQFYARRLRRLLPAAALCLLGVILVGALTDAFDAVTDLRSHVLGSVFQVANWVFLAGDGSYQDLLARTTGSVSPLEHFWSLAIEEQFYWFWPPVMLVVLSRVPRRRGRLVVVGALTVTSMIAAPVIAAVWGPDAAYWSTPARVGEIFVGALLAVALTGRHAAEPMGRLAPLSAGLLAVAVVTFPSSGGPAYAGALPLVGVVSAALVLGLQVDGPVRRALELPALVWIGRISYGLYLFHWPIFVLVDPVSFGWPAPAIFAVRLAATVTVSVLSYRLLEQPIRTARRAAPRQTFGMAGLVTAGIAVVALVGVSSGFAQYWLADPVSAEAASIEVDDAPLVGLAAGATSASPSAVPDATEPPDPTRAVADVTSTTVAAGRPTTTVARSTSTTSPETDETPPTTADVARAVADLEQPAPTVLPLPPLSRPTRIVVIGDSTANAFGTGLVHWAADHRDLAQVEIVAAPGCGILRGGERRIGDTIGPIDGCDDWLTSFAYPAVERFRPDVVMVMVTAWDVIDRRWDDGDLITPFDDEYRGRLQQDYDALRSRLEDAGSVRVAFVRQPIPDAYWLPTIDQQEEPARHEVVYELYDDLAAADPRVEVIELDRWLSDHGLDVDPQVRPDGIHPTPEAATDIADRYLGDQLVRIALGVARP